MIRHVLLLWIFVSTAATAPAQSDNGNGSTDDHHRVVYQTELDAPVDAVWAAFTTDEGLRSWMAPLVDIDLRVGGVMRANYSVDGNGELGDAATIENTILAFDPQRMLALKATKFPEGFPFAEAASGTWSVFYFEPLPEGRTRLVIVELGYTDDPQSQQMRGFFAQANEISIGKLKRALAEAEGD